MPRKRRTASKNIDKEAAKAVSEAKKGTAKTPGKSPAKSPGRGKKSGPTLKVSAAKSSGASSKKGGKSKPSKKKGKKDSRSPDVPSDGAEASPLGIGADASGDLASASLAGSDAGGAGASRRRSQHGLDWDLLDTSLASEVQTVADREKRARDFAVDMGYVYDTSDGGAHWDFLDLFHELGNSRVTVGQLEQLKRWMCAEDASFDPSEMIDFMDINNEDSWHDTGGLMPEWYRIDESMLPEVFEEFREVWLKPFLDHYSMATLPYNPERPGAYQPKPDESLVRKLQMHSLNMDSRFDDNDDTSAMVAGDGVGVMDGGGDTMDARGRGERFGGPSVAEEDDDLYLAGAEAVGDDDDFKFDDGKVAGAEDDDEVASDVGSVVLKDDISDVSGDDEATVGLDTPKPGLPGEMEEDEDAASVIAADSDAEGSVVEAESAAELDDSEEEKGDSDGESDDVEDDFEDADSELDSSGSVSDDVSMSDYDDEEKIEVIPTRDWTLMRLFLRTEPKNDSRVGELSMHRPLAFRRLLYHMKGDDMPNKNVRELEGDISEQCSESSYPHLKKPFDSGSDPASVATVLKVMQKATNLSESPHCKRVFHMHDDEVESFGFYPPMLDNPEENSEKFWMYRLRVWINPPRSMKNDDVESLSMNWYGSDDRQKMVLCIDHLFVQNAKLGELPTKVWISRYPCRNGDEGDESYPEHAVQRAMPKLFELMSLLNEGDAVLAPVRSGTAGICRVMSVSAAEMAAANGDAEPAADEEEDISRDGIAIGKDSDFYDAISLDAFVPSVLNISNLEGELQPSGCYDDEVDPEGRYLLSKSMRSSSAMEFRYLDGEQDSGRAGDWSNCLTVESRDQIKLNQKGKRAKVTHPGDQAPSVMFASLVFNNLGTHAFSKMPDGRSSPFGLVCQPDDSWLEDIKGDSWTLAFGYSLPYALDSMVCLFEKLDSFQIAVTPAGKNGALQCAKEKSGLTYKDEFQCTIRLGRMNTHHIAFEVEGQPSEVENEQFLVEGSRFERWPPFSAHNAHTVIIGKRSDGTAYCFFDGKKKYDDDMQTSVDTKMWRDKQVWRFGHCLSNRSDGRVTNVFPGCLFGVMAIPVCLEPFEANSLHRLLDAQRHDHVVSVARFRAKELHGDRMCVPFW